jgi:hypothetical protein
VAAASRARKQNVTLSIRCRVSHSGSILKIQRKAPRFAPVAAAAKTMRALRRSGAAAAVFEWLNIQNGNLFQRIKARH